MNDVWTSLTPEQQHAALLLVQDSIESLLHEPKNWVPWAMTSPEPGRVSIEMSFTWSLGAIDSHAVALRRTAQQLEATQVEALVRIVEEPDAGE